MNRRFIPFHFDLSPRGYLGDKAASKWVAEHLPEFARSSVQTPPVVFVTPEGKIIDRVSNYAPTETMIAKMQKVLKTNKEYNQFSPAESALQGIEKARLLIDLQRYDEAAKEIANDSSQQAQYLLGFLSRLKNDWPTAEKHFTKVTQAKWLDDVRMERAYRHWHTHDYPGLSKALVNFPSKSNRFSEAKYFEGLAFFHQGEKDKAKQVWKQLVNSSKEDRWVYRADWAYFETGNKKQVRSFSTANGGSTPLGRIGYMGNKHPDLKARSKQKKGSSK